MLGIAYCMFRAREDSFRCQKRTEFFEECLRVMNFCRDGKGLASRTERKISGAFSEFPSAKQGKRTSGIISEWPIEGIGGSSPFLGWGRHTESKLVKVDRDKFALKGGR